MAQHDYIIADQPGLAFRTDLNEGFAAIVSNNSGPTEPATTFAFQWWADTTSGVLKQRNAGNNDWIDILNLTTGRPTGAVTQTGATGAALLPEGDDSERPSPIPASGALLRGSSQDPADYTLEFWNRVSSAWQAIASRKWVTDFIAKWAAPAITGSAVLTGTDNKIVMTGVVTGLGLEAGDVVRVVAGAYNKLHTVESLTGSNDLVVNYEHCGSRGNGSLKLPDYTGTATITRIAKWYSTGVGVGQAWVDMTALRLRGVTYTSGPRPHQLLLVNYAAASQTNVQVTIGGVTSGPTSVGAADSIALSPVIPAATAYSYASDSAYTVRVMEQR